MIFGGFFVAFEMFFCRFDPDFVDLLSVFVIVILFLLVFFVEFLHDLSRSTIIFPDKRRYVHFCTQRRDYFGTFQAIN